VSERIDLPQGTLDLLILKTLSLTAMHGWAISERIRQISKDVVMVPQGSLYPALHRLERRGWISAEWGTSDSNRKAKFYKLTAAGRKQLAEDSKSWERLTAAVGLVMDARA
jgi:PadR family transcriptional regulator PadR